VELNRAPTGVAHLLGARVYDQNGRKLGRVHELRGHHEDDGSVVIDELLLGPKALLKRTRGPGPEARGIPVEAVIEVSAERVVVRG
jgi:sporulation protein YlmC with PRC-barrel domain